MGFQYNKSPNLDHTNTTIPLLVPFYPDSLSAASFENALPY